MTFSRIRQAVAAAGFILVAATSQAQSLGGNPGMIGAPGQNVQGFGPLPPGSVTPMAPVDLGALGSFPEQLMTDLALTPEQRAKVDVAQTARKTMWADNQVSRKAEYDELAKELKRGAEFDPHVVIDMRKQARAEMASRMDAVQDLWLEFWDSLDTKQREKMVDYMVLQHERHGRIRRPGP
jgi:hypothetical protein